MAHSHSIFDTDSWFSINPATRVISNHSSKLILIQYDHNSELFGFELPRYIEGHDMLLCNCVEVHYINVGAKSQNTGMYSVTDLQVLPEDEETVTCTWLISQNATQLVGSLHFVIRFACIEDDGTISYNWNTAIYSGIKISSGIYNSDHIVEQYADILESWKRDLYAEGLKISSVEQTTTSENDNGINTITFTMSDGSTNVFTVRNGSKGDTGDQGKAFTYEDFTAEQLKALTGPQGEKGDTGVTGATGPQGEKGEPGKNFTILDYYDTKEILEATIINPKPGDTYGIGVTEPYDIYVYSSTKGWVNNGKLQGARGEVGYYFTPSVDSDGNLNWTNNGGLVNPSAVNLKGPQGEDGRGISSIDTTTSSVSAGLNMVVIRLTDGSTESFNVMNGKDGNNGTNGRGIRSIETETSSSSGGTNTVTIKLTDGASESFSVKNGRNGATGPEGPQGPTGPQGPQGEDGVGILNIVPDLISSEDNGTNRILVELTDGHVKYFQVKNGSKGSTGPQGPEGPQGPAGYTPIRGTDYWTESDKTEIINAVLATLPAAEGVSV